MKHPALLIAGCAAAAIAVTAPAASAAGCTTGATTGCQVVAGTGLDVKALTVTGLPVFTDLRQNSTSTSAVPGVATITSTDPSWSLVVSDTDNATAANQGKLVDAAANPLCSGSTGVLANPVQVSLTSLTGVTGLGFVNIGTSAAPTTVAGPAGGSFPVSLAAATVNYRQVVTASEPIAKLCPYTMTATWTLQ